LSNPFGRDAERSQEVVLQLVAEWLNGKGSLHAQQPGISFFATDGKLLMEPRNTDRPIVLLKQLRTS
jgi:hypothetical protein